MMMWLEMLHDFLHAGTSWGQVRMLRHRALVVFPLLCVFTLATIVYLVAVCFPHTQTHSLHYDEDGMLINVL